MRSRLASRTSRARASAANGSDHAGSASSVTWSVGTSSRRGDGPREAYAPRAVDDVRGEGLLTLAKSLQAGQPVDEAPERRVAGAVQAPGRGRRRARSRPDASSVPASSRRRSASRIRLVEVALDAHRRDRGGGLPGEDGEQLHVTQRERGAAALVQHLEHAHGRFPVDERHRGDGTRHVAGPLGGRPVEARVAGDVAEGERAGPWRRRNRRGRGWWGSVRPIASGTPFAGRDPEHEAVGVGLEQGDRRRFRIEERGGGVDDGLEEALLRVARHMLGDAPTAGSRAQGGDDILTAVGRGISQADVPRWSRRLVAVRMEGRRGARHGRRSDRLIRPWCGGRHGPRRRPRPRGGTCRCPHGP